MIVTQLTMERHRRYVRNHGNVKRLRQTSVQVGRCPRYGCVSRSIWSL